MRGFWDWLRKQIFRFAIILNVAIGFFFLGFIFHFVVSLVRWDLSPWWFWPTGLIGLVGLKFLVMFLMGVGEKGLRG